MGHHLNQCVYGHLQTILNLIDVRNPTTNDNRAWPNPRHGRTTASVAQFNVKMKRIYSIFITIKPALTYTVLWWAVAFSWRLDMAWVGWLGVCLYAMTTDFKGLSRQHWVGVAVIALVGFGSDLIHAQYGILPPIHGGTAGLIMMLWIAFAHLLCKGVFLGLPIWGAPFIGAMGGWMNYAGLTAWMGMTPEVSLMWITVEWAILFPLFLNLARYTHLRGGKKSQHTVKSNMS